MKVVQVVQLVQGIWYTVFLWKPIKEGVKKNSAPVEPVEPKPYLNRFILRHFLREVGRHV